MPDYMLYLAIVAENARKFFQGCVIWEWLCIQATLILSVNEPLW